MHRSLWQSVACGVRRARVVLAGLLLLAALPAPALAEYEPVTDPGIEITHPRPLYDRRTRTYWLDVTVRNQGTATLSGPLRLVVESANKTLVNGHGSTGPGEPYADLSTAADARFAPGDSLGYGLGFQGGRGQLVATLRLEREVPETVNQPPVANAGADQSLTLPAGASTLQVTLDGTGSDDPDGAIARYEWTGVPDPADVARPTLALGVGTYSFSLVVYDDVDEPSVADTVEVIVAAAAPANEAPVAAAGDDRTLVLYPGEDSISVRLDGSASFDPDGRIETYRWSGAPDPDDTATAAIRLGEGVHAFTLTVTDDQGAESEPATVTLSVERLAEQQAPRVEVPDGPLTVTEGETLSFDVSADDPDGDPVALAAAPLIDTASFTATNGTAATGRFDFTPGVTGAGRYVFAFTARDPLGLAATETVTVDVLDADRAPTLSVPASVEVVEGAVLSFAVQAQDPDGDLVGVSATGLPENAVFVPGSGTLSFAPDYTQAGSYSIAFEAVANGATSGVQTTTVTVTDVPTGQAGGVSELTLNVDAVQSPTLLSRTRITGTVNAESTAPAAPAVVSALITGLAVASGGQGETLSVAITGSDSGRFATAFAAGDSEADFGDGIEVLGLTVNAADNAVAEIAIAADAALGPRPVTVRTGSEVAVSVVAFNVVPGTTRVSGRLLDPDTGDPIAGALVLIQGTGLSAQTDADGNFVIAGAPAGTQRLVVNTPNRAPVTLNLDLAPNATVDVGSLTSASLVYDPDTPPAATVPSIIARGVGDISGRIGLDDARQLVIDTFLAVGGASAGVQDEFGNQLNPLVEGDGLVTLPSELVDYTAGLMARGDSATLGEVLYGLAFASEWSLGAPPTLAKMLADLQAGVDDAWTDQRAPGAGIWFAIFNRGRTLSPSAPVLTPNTPLSALQRQLLVLSFFTDMVQVREANPDLFARATPGASAERPSFAEWLFGQVIPTVHAAGDPLTLPTDPGVFSTVLRNATSNSNIATGMIGGTGGGLASAFMQGAIGNACHVPSSKPNAGEFGGMIFGQVRGLFVQLGVATILRTLQPRAPLILSTEVIDVSPSGDAGPVQQKVAITFGRTNGDNGDANPPGLKFVYRLLRTKRPGDAPEVIAGGLPTSSADGTEGPLIDPDNPQQLIFVDADPPDGHVLYRLDVIRTVGAQSDADDNFNNLGNGIPWYLNLVPQPSLSWGAGRLSFNPAGTLIAVMDPLVQIANGLRIMLSPLSGFAAVYVGERLDGADPADGFVLGPDGLFGYVSVPAENAIDRVVLSTLGNFSFISAGFAAPHQSGLAIDSNGALYTENAATDARFGGKIFRYEGQGGAMLDGANTVRTHAGQTNYYSFLLGYARPTSVPAMVTSLDGELFVADALEGRIKKVPVNLTYDPYRRVGQPYATSPLFQFGPGMDMARGTDNALYITQPSTANVLYVPPGGGDASLLFGAGAGLFERPSSVAVDGERTLYVADQGLAPGGGYLLALPREVQAVATEPLDACTVARHTLADGLSNLSFVRLSADGRALYYREDGSTKRIGLGLTGRVRDADGDPLAGATVRVVTSGAQIPAVLSTDGCGFFRALGLQARGSSPLVQVEISHPTIGSQVYQAYLEPGAHGFRDFTLTDPVPPPAPEGDGQPPEPDPPLELPPPPEPVVVVAQPGDVTTAPIIEIEYVTVENGEDPCAGASPPPVQGGGCETEPEPETTRVTIVSPPDGGVVPAELRQQLETPMAGDVLRGIKVHVDGAAQGAANAVRARVNAIGSQVVFDSQPYAPTQADNLSILAHEVQHTAQTAANAVGAQAVTIDVEVTDAQGRVADAASVSLHMRREHPDAPGANAASVIGQVVDQATRDGIAGIAVVVEETGDKAYTDPNGLYQFPVLPPGPLTIGVEVGE